MSAPAGNEVVLVLGGARSGKSSWALKYVEQSYDSYLFLATAEVGDQEMAERVRLHQASRGPGWRLLEEPLEVAGALRTQCDRVEAVLLDCLTVWMSNVLLKRGEKETPRYQDDLLAALAERRRAVVVVSNEVGMGVVPESPLGRRFRDIAGHFNQRVAAIADRVVLMAAGLPLFLKGDAVVL